MDLGWENRMRFFLSSIYLCPQPLGCFLAFLATSHMAAMVLYHHCCACHRNANVLDEQTSAKEKWNNIAYAMIIGGAVGNLFDRIVHGSVVDYLTLLGLITGQHLIC